MFLEIQSVEELENLIATETALLVYFSNNACSVCKSLKPKVEQSVREEFPQMKLAYVKTDVLPEAAGQHRIFTVPVILVFFHGKETIRKIRSFSTNELNREINRPYSLIFG